MKQFISICILIFLTGLCLEGNAVTRVSNGNGDWEVAATWLPVGVPAAGDTMIINSPHTVTVTTNNVYSGAAMHLLVNIGATLHFATSGDKLSFPCGSTVIILGSLTIAGTGSGSSQSLKICNTTYWQKSDGPFTGPQYFPGGLPIELLSFNAIAHSENVSLDWATSSEVNNDYFEVERSENGMNWKSIAMVDGAGNSNVMLNYIETDNKPLEGVSYYRLKQTDFNGKFSYSSTVPVKYSKGAPLELILFPNPATLGQTVQIQIPSVTNKEVLVVLRDMRGREFYSNVVLSKGDKTFVGIPINSTIPKGTYIITATSDDRLYSKPLIII